MAMIETWVNQDLTAPVQVVYLPGNVFSQDNNGNLIGVNVFQGGEPATLSGSVSASVIRADGATVAVTGSLSGNRCSVVLPQACYAVPGVLSIVIKLTNGETVTTVGAVVANVYRSSTDSVVDPGTIIPDIATLIEEIQTAVASIPADYSSLMKLLGANDILLTGYETRGKFIDSYGSIITTSGTYAYSAPVPVSKGKKYAFTCVGTPNIAAVSSCDGNGGNISPVYMCSGTDEETFIYIPEKDGYIALSYNYSNDYILSSIDNTVGEISEEKTNLIDLSAIQYGINWTGSVAVDRACAFIVADPCKEYFINVPSNPHLWSVSIIEKNGYIDGALKSTTINTGEQSVIKTTDNTTMLIIQFNGAPDGYTLSQSDFSGYGIALYRYSDSSDITAIDSFSRSVFDIKDNIIDPAQIEIGKNWTGGTAANRAVVVVPVQPNKPYLLDIPVSSYWSSVSLVQKKDKWNVSLKSDTVSTNQGYRFITETEAYWLYIQFNGNATITANMFNGYDIYLCDGSVKLEAADDLVRDSLLGWKNKKMVWLGTSIPAGGKDGLDNRHAYPNMVGDILHSIVFNEAVGSSALHCKVPGNISESNPYGFMNNFEAVSRCITNSLVEMEWIIEHYNDDSVFTVNVPASLSDSDKEFIRSCSWENKLGKYFTAAKFPDVWVFDHGHNDAPTEASEATYTARTILTGAQHNGFYQNGALIESSASSYIEFDVSNVEEVWLSATIGQYYDVYDLFDGSGNLLSYKANASERVYTDFFIDTSSASVLRVSAPNILVNTIEVKKYTYGSMYNSLYSYQGAMDFLINKIKEYNPKARIVMIGEYENQKFPNVSYYQKVVAERWEFPLYEQWKNLGWSQQLVKVDGVYKTYLEVFIPDNLHPHTDTTGLASRLMAENIAAWFETIR